MLLNRGLSKEFRESLDEDDEMLKEQQTNESTELKENELTNLESNKLTDNLNRIKLNEQSNSNFLNQTQNQNRISSAKVSNEKYKTLEEIKENDYQNGHRVRSIKSNHELDELIKENAKSSNDINAIQNDVQKIFVSLKA